MTVIKATFSAHPYVHLDQLHDELKKVIYSYADTVPLVGVLGILDLLKAEIIEEAQCPSYH